MSTPEEIKAEKKAKEIFDGLSKILPNSKEPERGYINLIAGGLMDFAEQHASQAATDGWIKTDERLPEVKKTDGGVLSVLAIVENNPLVVSFFPKDEDNSKDRFYISFGNVFDECTSEVTYWKYITLPS